MNKSCLNCGYFIQYYIKQKTGFKCVAGKGHCANSHICVQSSQKRLRDNSACELWQPAQIQKDELRADIKDALYRICKQLENIACVLKNEE